MTPAVPEPWDHLPLRPSLLSPLFPVFTGGACWAGFGLAAVRCCSVPSLKGWGGKSERKISI